MTRSRSVALALSLPWALALALFWLFPFVYSFLIGFTDYQLLVKGFNWVGLDNYKQLLSDPAFVASVKNTFIFVIGTPKDRGQQHKTNRLSYGNFHFFPSLIFAHDSSRQYHRILEACTQKVSLFSRE